MESVSPPLFGVGVTADREVGTAESESLNNCIFARVAASARGTLDKAAPLSQSTPRPPKRSPFDRLSDQPMARRSRCLLMSPVVLASVALVGAACGGGPEKGSTADKIAQSTSAAACAAADTTALYVAVKEYISTVRPTPQRFLSAAGTDSAVPEDAFKALQDKGPSFFYSSDTAAQRQIRDKLAAVGPYASLLVLFKGKTASSTGDSITVQLGGQYVGGEHEGKRAAMGRYVVQCDSSRWKLVSATLDSSATR